MQNRPLSMRDRLLDMQEVSPDLRDKYHRELDSLLHVRLTPRTRWATYGGIMTAIGFIALCVRSLTSPHATIDSMAVAGSVAIASGIFAAWCVQIVRRGGFARTQSFAVTEMVGSLVVGTVVCATFLTGMGRPSDPAATYWAMWGLLLLIVGFAWATGNRISAASLESREHLLRIEARLAELADRMSLPPNDLAKRSSG